MTTNRGTIRAHTTPIDSGALTQAALDSTAPDHWYGDAPGSREEWAARARQRARSSAGWLRALEPALGSGAKMLERVASGGVVVTAGQQPGLFGGPLYTWFKALSALELARVIERETGVPAAPVFWAATDDADFQEAAATVLAGSDGPVRLEVSRTRPEGVPLCDVPLGDDVSALFAQLRAACGSIPDARAIDAAAAFAPGQTFGGAYVAMLRALLEPLGVAVLDASHDATAEASRTFLQQAQRSSAAVHDALDERARAIEASGIRPQVDSDRGLSLVFAWSPDADGVRYKTRLRVGAPHGSGDRLSPNVLLRPVVESELLPTVAYMGGPGEVAYFAQVSAVAATLGATQPLIVPRWSGMLEPPDVAEALSELGLTHGDLSDPHAAERRLSSERVPEEAREAIAALKQAVARELGRMNGALPPAALEGARAQFDIRISRVERRLRANVRHRESGDFRALAALRGQLFPLGKPQERVLNAVPLWSRYGDEMIDAVREAAAAHARRLVAGVGVPA